MTRRCKLSQYLGPEPNVILKKSYSGRQRTCIDDELCILTSAENYTQRIAINRKFDLPIRICYNSWIKQENV
jgi:hypothetical protein